MASTTPTVAATLRERLGTRYTRRLRAQGMLPVVIYGHGEKPVSAAVNAKEMLGHLHHGLIQLLHHISKVGWHLCRVLAPRGNELAGLSHTHRMWRCQGCR